MKDGVFNKLNSIDVKPLTKKKGNFDYLSWSNAVREASKVCPSLNWEFTKYGDYGLPYLETPLGFFVECSVTILEVTKTQMMPVLDHKNQTCMKPNAAMINKSQMRALTKAIALHGLGIDLWAGEDIGDYDDEGTRKINYKSFSMDKAAMIESINGGMTSEEVIQQLESNYIVSDKVKTEILKMEQVND